MAWVHSIAAIGLAVSGCAVASRLGVSPAGPAGTGPGGPSGGQAAAAASAGPEHRTLTVPDVIGKPADEARAIARAAGFTSEIEINPAVHCGDAPRVPGRIQCQDPEPGARVSSYAMIQIAVYTPGDHPGQLVRDQLEALRGLTPDQARQRLARLGHVGKVTLGVVVQFDPSCGPHKVCGTSGDGGIDVHDDLVLQLNPSLEISTPPP